MLGTHVQDASAKDRCNEISHKVEKEGKPHGKNPPPKREISKIKENEREEDLM